MNYKAIDLFCGLGGLSLGLERAGFEVLAGVDNWKEALRSYKRNFQHPGLMIDLSGCPASQILEMLPKPPAVIDLLAGGPPCQGFSVQRIGDDRDFRNDLVIRFGFYVEAMQPRTFLMENVPGLLGKRGFGVMSEFTAAVSSAGYQWRTFKVDAADFGVPQHRRRVFVYGWREVRAE